MRLHLTVTTASTIEVAGKILHANSFELVTRKREMERFVGAELDKLYDYDDEGHNYPYRVELAAKYDLPDAAESVIKMLGRRLYEVYGPGGNGWLPDARLEMPRGLSMPSAKLSIPRADLSEEDLHLFGPDD